MIGMQNEILGMLICTTNYFSDLRSLMSFQIS